MSRVLWSACSRWRAPLCFVAWGILGLTWATLVAGTTAAADAGPMQVDPMDWPNWRGPEQNSISRETGLIDKWNPAGGEGSNVLWSSEAAAGISTPIVMRGKLYTLSRCEPGTKHEQEMVICLDAATGKELWRNKFNVYLSSCPAERVGWSSCVGDPTTGRVYALGVCGLFQCIDGDSGKTIWSHSLHEEYGLLSTYGGRTNVPIVFDDLVIISSVIIGWGDMARPAHRFMAFDKSTGAIRWFNGTKPLPEDTTYSTPMTSVLNDQAAMVFGSSDGAIWNFQPRTGKSVWNFRMSRRGISTSPVVKDGIVYAGQADENLDNSTQGAVAAFKGTGTGDITDKNLIWQAKEIGEGKSSPLLVDGRLYCADDLGSFFIFDAATGKQIGKPVKLVGTIVRASPLYADGKIYLCSTSGWHVFAPTSSGVKLVNRMRLEAADEISGSPIVSHGRIYVPTGAHLYCLGKADAKPAATPIPPAPAEPPVDPNDKPAQLQIVPCDVIVQSGRKQQFEVRLFNARGQVLKSQPVDFSLQGPGEMTAGGQYTAASEPAHTATIVTAKLGEVTGQARIRVMPPLPWKFDFSDTAMTGPNNTGEPPITWIGMRYRHQIRDIDGNKMMVKITTIPKGTKSQGWIGPPDLHDYTIQADFFGGKGPIMPDMGLIAQRYTLDLMGASQQLQIRSWAAQIHTQFSKSVPFTWQIGKWYTMKFQAANEGGKAVLRGKVWPRDEKEPAAWSIEAADETPNVVGAPGFYGESSSSEIQIDNVQVTAN